MPILRIEDAILAGAGIDVEVHHNEGKKARFSKWCLMHDWSLVGLTKDELRAQLRAVGMGYNDEETEDWDSHGVELVSPPLAPSVEAFAELRRYLSVLNHFPPRPNVPVPGQRSPIQDKPATSSTGLYRAMASKGCGLHVHVGLPPSTTDASGDDLPPTFELGHMQHLAYILVMYEPYISSLHPFRRRDPQSPTCEIQIRSNRQEMIQEPVYDPDENWNPEEIDWDEPQVENDEPELDFAFVRQQIFGPDVTMEVLVKRMCPGKRAHIVNLTNLIRTDGCARTIEFRQAAGTLDPDDIEHWVKFCVSLVRLAYEMARRYGTMNAAEVYDGTGYPYREWNGGMSVEDLFEMMGFDEEEMGYWSGRVERCKDE